MLNFPVLDAKETIEGDIAIPSEEQEDELSQFGKVNEPSVAAISGAQQRESGVLVIFKFLVTFVSEQNWTYWRMGLFAIKRLFPIFVRAGKYKYASEEMEVIIKPSPIATRLGKSNDAMALLLSISSSPAIDCNDLKLISVKLPWLCITNEPTKVCKFAISIYDKLLLL